MAIKNKLTQPNKITQPQAALNGLIELWADVYSTEIYFIQGKRFTASQLAPYIKAALAGPSSSIHTIVEADPQKADACIKYARILGRVRRNIIIQNLIREELRDHELLYFFNYAFYLVATLYISFGIMFAEAERRMKQSFGRMLSRITLRQLLSEPSENDIPSEFRLHTWLSSLPLSPGSVAGANVRLKGLLNQWLKIFSGDTCYYEQTIKIALWDCWNGSHIDECVKILCQQGDITQQMLISRRMLDGEEPKLLRTMFLAMLRRTIEGLDEIRQEIRQSRAWNTALPLPDNIESTKASALWHQIAGLSKEEGKQAIIEVFSHKGISYNDLTAKEWAEIFERYDVIRRGHEFSSKTGISISSFYGKSAHAKEQKWSRIKKKIHELSE